MEKNLVEAKLNQLLRILDETESWLAVPLAEFSRDTKLIRACQRNLQLLVEYASDINGILILEGNQKVPGSYRESFTIGGTNSFTNTSPRQVTIYSTQP